MSAMANNGDPTSVGYALREKFNVMHAVVLRDMRTRFFDHGLGFLIVALWPLGHMVILLAIYHIAGRQAPFGESLNVFFATGLIPTLLFMYVSRFMSLSVVLNKPMLAFPVVHVLDILMARAYLEVLAGFLTLAFMVSILLLLGDDPWPADPIQALLAYLSTILLAVGVGILVGVVAVFFNFAVTLYALLMILAYISSGTLFVSAYLPDAIALPLSWNPITQTVEWMRTAYFETYPDRLLDRGYLVGVGLVALFGGLLLERCCRRIMLES
ncbi:ABC transporter permease [Ensifer sp. SL37]|uniref:ABC transporter permease n=1 Tax=Ensifer sp. SL37 TaxID=2995137 RepID=UPI0022746D79|nr:capsular biosynthesis protein [Ensifer sp. SL37]MCY1740379.1 capsular biosynthesis protein [Ensifer sp. SL37]